MKLVRYRDTPARRTLAPAVVAGQRLVAGLRLAAGQRLVAGLWVSAGQRLFMYVEGSLFRLYWKLVYESSEWHPKISSYASIEFSNACVLLCDKIYPEVGQIMALYTVPLFASKDAAMKRKCRKLIIIRDPVEDAIAELKQCIIISSILDYCFPV